ncbi:MAG: MBL fold metallo-hydrolase [bacterium]
MTLRATILGSGSSGGVPRPGGEDGTGAWGACDPANPKNRRMRCSLLVQKEHPELGWDTDQLTTILVDTSPDFREQMLLAKCGRLDGVLFTHDHADQTHGIDDLRVIAINMRARVPVWVDEATSGRLLSRFSYCFEQAENSSYPPILHRQIMPECGKTEEISGPSGPISFTPFLQNHGRVNSLGFIFGPLGKGGLAYSSDVKALPEESFSLLSGISCWIVDSLRYTEHPSHANVTEALSWIARLNPHQAVLTNMHIDLDYETLMTETPKHVTPAYDGMVVEV